MNQSSETKMLSFPVSEKKINRTNLAYIAGMLDADGTITGAIGTRTYIRVSIANINKDMICWIAELIGGTVMIRRMPDKYPLYLWHCPASEVTRLMKLLIPFLRIKQRQARLAQIFRLQMERKVAPEKRARTLQKIFDLNLCSGKMIESKPTAT